MLAIQVKSRGREVTPEMVRDSGSIPAVFYGPKQEATSISIDGRLLERVWKDAGQTSVVSLEGVGESKEALIHDVQVHPVTGNILHADFYVLEKGKKITISVPLEFAGHAPAEKAGHILVKALHEIEIEVLPAELPHTLPVDLSSLENVGDRVVASDIKLPPSATLITNGEEIIASITAFKEDKAETPVAGAAPAGPAAAPVQGEAPASK